MVGELTSEQIKQVLLRQTVGRLGCSNNKQLYITPIAFAFDGKDIVAYARKEGMKINLMRTNPNVCFEVDEIENLANWRSVLLLGHYHEIKSRTERSQAMKILMDKLGPLPLGETTPEDKLSHAPEIIMKKKYGITFRIEVKEMTGRFEKSH